MGIATVKAIGEAAKYMVPLIIGIEAAAQSGEYMGEDLIGRAVGDPDWYKKAEVYAKTHAPASMNLNEFLHGMYGNPGHGNPGNPKPKKKRKPNRYAILLKQEMKKSRLIGKTAAGRKKKFAAAAKKASRLYKKEKKNGKTKKSSA